MLQRLIYYTADINQAVSLMQASGLNREKWYRKRGATGYINHIAERAMSTMNTFYDWNREVPKNTKEIAERGV